MPDVPAGLTTPGGSARRIAVVVMGMHRSGTSALARVLNLLGCQAPLTLMGGYEFNPRGHWESESIRQFNDEILQAVGSGWSDWGPFNPDFAKSPNYAAYRERAVALLRSEFDGHRLVVFKDPRICRLGAFWLDALEDAEFEPAVVLPLRNPLEVAESLSRRDGIDESYVQLLWLRYVLDAETSTRGRRRIFTTFEDLLEGWEALVARIGAGLDLGWPRYSASVALEVSEFLDASLRHHARGSRAIIANPGISAWLRDTYATLENWAHNGEDARGYARLDDIRGQLDASASAFGKVILTGERARLRAQALEAQLAELQQAGQQVAILQQQLAALQGDRTVHAELAEEQQRSLALGRELEALQNRLADHESALRQKQEEAAQAWAEVAAGREHSAALAAQSAQLEQRAEALSQSLAASEGWVFKLADARQQADRRSDRLDREVHRLGRELTALKGEAARLREALGAAEHRARADAEDAARNQAQDMRAEFEARQQALRADLHSARKALSEAERRQEDSSAELVVLTRKLKDSEETLAAELSLRLEREAALRQLQDAAEAQAASARQAPATPSAPDLHAMRKALSEAERRDEEQSAELVVLTRKLQDVEKSMASKGDSIEWLRAVLLAVTRLPWWWYFLPPQMRRARELDRLQQRGLFDASAYLAEYPDVVATGLDPLRHFVRHGMVEGRHR